MRQWLRRQGRRPRLLSAISSLSAVPLLKDEAHSKIPASSFFGRGKERKRKRKRARAHIEYRDGNDAEMDDPTNPYRPTSGSRRKFQIAGPAMTALGSAMSAARSF